MKTFILCLTALCCMLPVYAQNEPIVVARVEGREMRFNWPRSGNVFVRDVRTINLPAGRSRLQLEGLSQVVADSATYAASLRLSPPAKLIKSLPPLKLGSTPKPASATFFDNFVGQRVTLLQETRTGEKTVSGILRLTDGRYSLETADGILYAPSGQWILPQPLKQSTPATTEADAVRNATPNAVDPVCLVAGNGKTQVEADYVINNMSWSPRYTGFLLPDRKTIQMQGAILLTTPNDFDFRGAIFKLVDPEGIVQIADDTEIRSGVTAVSFWSGVFNVQQALSFYNTDWNKNIGSEYDYVPVQHTYKTQENGGAFLPRGSLTLWQQNEDGTTFPSNFENFGSTKADSPLILPLSDHTKESTVVRTVTSNKLLNPQTREVVISWKVRSREGGPTLSITDTLPDDADIKETSLKPVENSGKTLRFEVTGTTEFSYRFQIPNR
jgi:hypothetical protein